MQFKILKRAGLERRIRKQNGNDLAHRKKQYAMVQERKSTVWGETNTVSNSGHYYKKKSFKTNYNQKRITLKEFISLSKQTFHFGHEKLNW